MRFDFSHCDCEYFGAVIFKMIKDIIDIIDKRLWVVKYILKIECLHDRCSCSKILLQLLWMEGRCGNVSGACRRHLFKMVVCFWINYSTNNGRITKATSKYCPSNELVKPARKYWYQLKTTKKKYATSTTQPFKDTFVTTKSTQI